MANSPSNAPLTPDYIDHGWAPLAAASVSDGFVHVRWPDGAEFAAYSLWLAENADGYGLEPTVRESALEPTDLPSAAALVSASVDDDGALLVGWEHRAGVRIHPGWLRYVADRRHLPESALPATAPWTAAEFAEPPTIDGSEILDDESVLERWLTGLVRHGICRLADTPTDLDFVGRLVGSIGPIRDTNFGRVWSVRADVDPNSTANTGLDLGQHTDLPTREVPPGFQFLHCIENTVDGGWSRMSDGLAVVEAIRSEHPDAYDALTTLEWVFMNRARDAEHRWVGPIIDHGSASQPLTLRAFYPVRSAPHMAADDIPRAYESLRIFATVARDPRFQIRYPFRPGDLVGFDNRRVLHGRDAFEGGGSRHLRGCYSDHDDLYSKLRVLRRPAPRPESAHPTSEVSA
ncbi:TauD/TfdA family dioxygenase [Ilumatobacter sp.]|uniref:TauD/TfdA family dioxygenase n=1 Tax=Ilumatobacter sp. TaxID=1967498 RepID=UPI003AF9E570